MRRFITLLLLAFSLFEVTYAQQMSDDQVVNFVKEAQKSGKSQKQIVMELSAKGVTKEQAERIKSRYEQGTEDVTVANVTDQNRRTRKKDESEGVTSGSLDVISTEIEDPTKKKGSSVRQVFGRDIFNTRNLTFEPSSNIATPTNYKLGPGDEVIIDIWGSNETTIRGTISPEGSIMVTNLGPVYLNGMTVKEANVYLQRELAKIYAGIGGNDPSSQIKLTLGAIRSIQINVMGEVAIPGTYTLSSFSTVFHALYRAGGVSNIGSLRSIKVMRGSRCVADVDVYDYILRGKQTDDVHLMEGDVILVAPYDALVDISGNVKRPMYYEMKKTETLSTLLKYAGSFTGDAYTKSLRLVRKKGTEYKLFSIDEMDYSVFKLMDGDAVTVSATLDRFENRVEIRGAVYRPGQFQLDGKMNTVKQLIARADGLKGDAFLNRAQITREREDLTLEIIPIDLKALMEGKSVDIPLMKNDVLTIASIHEIKDNGTLTIYGQVAKPGEFPYADNTTVEDLILQAGGLLEPASIAKVDVARRIKDPMSVSPTNQLGENFTFSIKDGLVIDGPENFILKPFDVVFVRRSPSYQEQRIVSVLGEVVFTGSYSLDKKNQRISELIERAGGITKDAYLKGARLVRQMTKEELLTKQAAIEMASRGGKDSIALSSMEVRQAYNVGIDLEKALENPRSEYDVVLREGDQVFIPEMISTVKINGAVMYPNTVVYDSKQNLNYYISQAGGYRTEAKKSKTYIIYMNGNVKKVRGSSRKLIQPGCEIIVPVRPEKKKMSTGEIISVGTSIASLATMIATLVTLIKK